MSYNQSEKFDLNELDSTLWLNDHLSEDEERDLCELFESFRSKNNSAHVWVASSGSRKSAGESNKLIALSHEALKVSAQAVNRHLQVGRQDVWLKPLPSYHVGGMSIYARAQLADIPVHELDRWSPEEFKNIIQDRSVSLSSLVPTQVFDLVQNKIASPKSLRAVVVGGAALDPKLYLEARNLGWPLLPSFGMTELGSQVATASLASLAKKDFPSLSLLEHIDAKVSQDDILEIRSKALMSGYAQKIKGEKHFIEVPAGTWLRTQDRAFVENGNLKFLGRADDFVKILGEGVSLGEIEQTVKLALAKSDLQFDVCVFSQDDARKGAQILLALEDSTGSWKSEKTQQKLLSTLQSLALQLPTLKRWSQLNVYESFPKSPLGKLQKSALQNLTPQKIYQTK